MRLKRTCEMWLKGTCETWLKGTCEMWLKGTTWATSHDHPYVMWLGATRRTTSEPSLLSVYGLFFAPRRYMHLNNVFTHWLFQPQMYALMYVYIHTDVCIDVCIYTYRCMYIYVLRAVCLRKSASHTDTMQRTSATTLQHTSWRSSRLAET